MGEIDQDALRILAIGTTLDEVVAAAEEQQGLQSARQVLRALSPKPRPCPI